MLRGNNPQVVLLDLPPPGQNFEPAGTVLLAEFRAPWFLRQKRYTGKRAEGVRYEKRVQEFLADCYGGRYAPSPWFRFFANSKWRWCQPDGLLFDPKRGIINIVEVKHSHTSDAWWQTKHLYGPVVQWLFPQRLWRIQFVEICRWYDPQTPFPEPIRMTPEIEVDTSAFKVHIWKP